MLFRSHTKATGPSQLGAPLQGRLSRIFVKPGESVKRNTPLFTIEAMKMETTITASQDLQVNTVFLKEGTMVEAEDLVLETK